MGSLRTARWPCRGGSARRVSRRHVFAIHDVAPSRFDEAVEWRRLIAERTLGPVSLLIVPYFHLIDEWTQPVTTWLQAVINQGDEPVLHGYSHAAARGGDEREFRTLSAGAAAARMQLGRQALAAVGMNCHGFIAPCYAAPRLSSRALHVAGLQWWATRLSINTATLSITVPSLGVGASTAMRRAVTPTAVRLASQAIRRAPRVRIDLHPADLHHPRLRAAGIELIERAVEHHGETTTHSAMLDEDPDDSRRDQPPTIAATPANAMTAPLRCVNARCSPSRIRAKRIVTTGSRLAISSPGLLGGFCACQRTSQCHATGGKGG